MSSKFTGKDAVLVWGGVQVPCLQSVNTSDSIDVATAECAGSTGKEKFPGLSDAKLDINLMPTDDDIATLLAFTPGTTDTFEFYPRGIVSGRIQISGSALISSRTLSTSLNNVFALSCNMEVTGAFTIAAVP